MVEDSPDSFTGSGGFEKGYDLIDTRFPEAENLASGTPTDEPLVDPFADDEA